MAEIYIKHHDFTITIPQGDDSDARAFVESITRQFAARGGAWLPVGKGGAHRLRWLPATAEVTVTFDDEIPAGLADALRVR